MNKNNKEKPFKEYLAEIESPEYDGADASWGLPKNPTSLEKAKYELCEKILGHQEDNNLSDEVLTRKLHLNQAELEDILFCRISKFTLDYLMNVASKLFLPAEIKVVVETQKDKIHVRTV